MEKKDDSRRYKWTTPAINLLVSIWSHEQVQNQLGMLTRNQPIWESIARYMSRRGFVVSGLQCRTRIKNMLCAFHEAERKGDPSLLGPYYKTFKMVERAKASKKKEGKGNQKIKIEETSDLDENDEDDNQNETTASYDGDTNEQTEEMYDIEYLESSANMNDTTTDTSKSSILHLEKVITSAIETQTRTITKAIEAQTVLVEALLNAERERLETIMAAERESRRQLETRLDRLISRLDHDRCERKDQEPGVMERGLDLAVYQRFIDLF